MENFKSPVKKLMAFFKTSRDKWKEKCKQAMLEIRSLKKRIEFLETSEAELKGCCVQSNDPVVDRLSLLLLTSSLTKSIGISICRMLYQDAYNGHRIAIFILQLQSFCCIRMSRDRPTRFSRWIRFCIVLSSIKTTHWYYKS